MNEQTILIEDAIEEASKMDPDLFQSEFDFEFARRALMTLCSAGGKPTARMTLSILNDHRYWKKRDGK